MGITTMSGTDATPSSAPSSATAPAPAAPVQPAPAPPAAPAPVPRQAPAADGGDDADPKWKALSRQNEAQWRKATSDLEKAQQTIADRDVALADLTSSSASEVATAKLARALTRAGMADEQIDNFVQFLDPKRLLKDGKPDADAIKAIAASIPATLRQALPDPDQGAGRGGQAPLDMNGLIRQRAGIQ